MWDLEELVKNNVVCSVCFCKKAELFEIVQETLPGKKICNGCCSGLHKYIGLEWEELLKNQKNLDLYCSRIAVIKKIEKEIESFNEHLSIIKSNLSIWMDELREIVKIFFEAQKTEIFLFQKELEKSSEKFYNELYDIFCYQKFDCPCNEPQSIENLKNGSLHAEESIIFVFDSDIQKFKQYIMESISLKFPQISNLIKEPTLFVLRKESKLIHAFHLNISCKSMILLEKDGLWNDFCSWCQLDTGEIFVGDGENGKCYTIDPTLKKIEVIGDCAKYHKHSITKLNSEVFILAGCSQKIIKWNNSNSIWTKSTFNLPTKILTTSSVNIDEKIYYTGQNCEIIFIYSTSTETTMIGNKLEIKNQMKILLTDGTFLYCLSGEKIQKTGIIDIECKMKTVGSCANNGWWSNTAGVLYKRYIYFYNNSTLKVCRLCTYDTLQVEEFDFK